MPHVRESHLTRRQPSLGGQRGVSMNQVGGMSMSEGDDVGGRPSAPAGPPQLAQLDERTPPTGRTNLAIPPIQRAKQNSSANRFLHDTLFFGRPRVVADDD